MFSKWCVLALCCARLITLLAKRCTYSRGVTWQHLVPGGVVGLLKSRIVNEFNLLIILIRVLLYKYAKNTKKSLYVTASGRRVARVRCCLTGYFKRARFRRSRYLYILTGGTLIVL